MRSNQRLEREDELRGGERKDVARVVGSGVYYVTIVVAGDVRGRGKCGGGG